ncbi:MAG: hypothetical protein GC137_07205 [Alphaproteobacteria bacterium]|nr:hypothetical protein [Alphaproteobacteria bacterium]
MFKKLLGLLKTEQKENKTSIEIQYTSFSDIEENILRLSKQATEYKKSKKYEDACKNLKEIIFLYERKNETPPAELRGRLAKYLQIAGKNDEGWAQINLALSENPLDSFALSKIHNDARIFLQKEKREKDQLFHGFLSHIYLVKAQYDAFSKPNLSGLDPQEYEKIMGKNSILKLEALNEKTLHNQLEKFASHQAIENCVHYLIKKTVFKTKEEKILAVFENYIKQLPRLDIIHFSEDLKEALNN